MVSRPLCQNGFEPIKMIKMYFEDVERGFRLAWHKTPTLFESNNTRQYLVDLFDCLEIDNKGLIV